MPYGFPLCVGGILVCNHLCDYTQFLDQRKFIQKANFYGAFAVTGNAMLLYFKQVQADAIRGSRAGDGNSS